MPLIKLFLDICFFRRGPESVPRSGFLLVLTLLLNLLTSLILGWIETDLQQGALQALVAVSLLAVYLCMLLWLVGKVERTVQTLTAALACDGLFTGVALVLTLLTPLLSGPWAGAVWLGLMIWEIGVIGHILRRALGWPFAGGLALALAYMLLSIRTMMALFPDMS